MNYYLIDYENTKNLLGVNNLSENDIVVIFYSNKANTVSFDTLKEIVASKAKFYYKAVEVGGQNALDFQLGSYLGYIIKENENTDNKIFIISKDKGFSYISSFWKKEKSIDIKIIANLTGEQIDEVEKNKTQTIGLENELLNSPLKLNNEEIEIIIDISKKYKTLQAINNNINKSFNRVGQKPGDIYKIVKQFIKNKQNNLN